MKKTLSNIGSFIAKQLTAIIVILALVICAVFLLLGSRAEDGSITLDGRDAQYSDAQRQASCELAAQRDAAIAGLTGINVPQDSTSGCEPSDLPQMGSLVYYDVDVSSPTAFYNAVNGRGFNEGYGFQCVAAFKEFMFALSGKYVAAAGGGAKGYATQQAQIEPLGFKWYSGTSGMKDGDWAIWTNGQYGHVAMYFRGQFFSQNQYASNPNVGNPFNLANVSKNGIAGYYRPNIYQSVTPTPEPEPTPNPDNGSGANTGGNTSNSYTVRRGDTLGGISLNQGWWVGTNGLYGDSGYAQRLAERNGIQYRGLIYPNQVIQRAE